MSSDQSAPLYGLVAYVRSELGEFVENLRAELHPAHAHLPAHVSILPPRPLRGAEPAALQIIEERAASFAPFEVEMGDVESFIPTTPTVFIRVARAAYRVRELHDLMNVSGLEYQEPLAFMPHLTIAKLETVERAREVYEISRQRWARFSGSRKVTIESLVFVRGRDASWTDLAIIELSGVAR